jgi:hypothetical protein
MATKHLKKPVIRSNLVTSNRVNLLIESFPSVVRNRLGRIVAIDRGEVYNTILLRVPTLTEGHPELLRLSQPYNSSVEIKNMVDMLIDSLGGTVDDAAKVYDLMMKQTHKLWEPENE